MLNKEECEKALYELSLMTAIAEKEECNGCSCESCGLRKDSECKGNSYLWYFKKLIEEHFNKNTLVKCEKCGKEMPYVLINKFNYSGSDSFLKYSYNRIGGCVSIVADRNWTGYELSEEEMLETIVCPHCGKYPFQSKEIHVYDEVEIVMFPKENKNVD